MNPELYKCVSQLIDAATDSVQTSKIERRLYDGRRTGRRIIGSASFENLRKAVNEFNKELLKQEITKGP